MTVQELIDRLVLLPSDSVVVLAKDAEGNDYSPLADICSGTYYPENTWSGEFQDEDDDEPMWDEDRTRAVALWPVN